MNPLAAAFCVAVPATIAAAVVIAVTYLMPPTPDPAPVQASFDRMVAAYRENADAKDRLIEALRTEATEWHRAADALKREAEAATNLAAEREKTLALYRQRCPAP
jgi:Skp family chaperone for outer membrane proteins